MSSSSCAASHKSPRKLYEFLRLKENKEELFAFLAQIVTNNPLITDKMILNTYHDNVLCNLPCDTSRLAPCTQEWSDTRIFLYLEDIVKEGCDKIIICTVHTDVEVLAVAASQRLSHIQLWIAYGVGKHFRFLAAHEIATALRPSKCRALPFCHALSDCDIVSFFHGNDKKAA